MTLDALIDDLLKREGGYVDHPHDRGGPTHYGITMPTLREWRGRPVTVQDIKDLPVEEARAIYRRNYVERPGFDQIEDGALKALLVDCGVHHGITRARLWVRTLQKLGGLKADGVIGPVTVAAITKAGPDLVRRELLRLRGHFVAGILQRDPKQRVFAAGWLRRLLEFL